ncbi:MAG TPA: LamB/YcsF family protein [Dehalococcoidia bacterium]|nr:LamB/YcsF family protein [Dehalococcoidia bacterium]
MAEIDLNCDVGESFGAYKLGFDEELIKHVSSANIACGFHAGDPMVMQQTMKLAKTYEVKVGAHPGYPDLLGFGRRDMAVAPTDVKSYLIYQIGALQAFARVEGLELQHIKPHGALYNTAVENPKLAQAIAEAVRSLDEGLILVALAGSAWVNIAKEQGLRVAGEAFADRAYSADGRLVPRSQPGAVIKDKKIVAERVIRMIEEGQVRAITGEDITINADTICLHGDTPGALELAVHLRGALQDRGISIAPLEDVVEK